MGFTAAVLPSPVGLRVVRGLFKLGQLAHHPERARRAVQHCCCEAHAQLRVAGLQRQTYLVSELQFGVG